MICQSHSGLIMLSLDFDEGWEHLSSVIGEEALALLRGGSSKRFVVAVSSYRENSRPLVMCTDNEARFVQLATRTREWLEALDGGRALAVTNSSLLSLLEAPADAPH
jgi:hypothetical protein